MNKYTIYCTAEQTKKALELGASIKLLLDDFTDNYEDCEVYAIPPQEDELGIMCNYAVIPTAEQMINWLEEQKNIREICLRRYGNWGYEIFIDPYFHLEEYGFISRKEATLAAIDAVLDYLKTTKENSHG